MPAVIIVAGILVGIAGSIGSTPGSGYQLGTLRNDVTFGQAYGTQFVATMTATGPGFGAFKGAQGATSAAADGGVQEPSTIVLPPNPASASTVHSTTPKAASSSSSPGQSGSIEFFSNLTLRVSSPQSALTRAAGVAYSIGGYVAFSSSTNNSATAVLRVPASEYQNALTQVEAIGNVTNFVSTSNDVTIKYTDMNATLQSLLTERDAFVRLLSQSTRLNTTIAIEGYLQGVDAQINSVQSEILQTRRLIDYATITATFARGSVMPPLSVKVVASPLKGATPLSVTFRAFEKGGVPGYFVYYNFGDGTAAQGEALIHTYTKVGDYNTTISVTDSSGNVRTSSVMIHALGAPVGFDFAGFTNLTANLFFSVIQGIVEVAIVVIPITLVAALVFIVIAPIRSRLRSIKASNGKAA
ncbi:MAG: DUF4349 domain-containing protein [Thaumarchaeota archaeon]|nr:MAG: DUF4349 domain-containing protein [Nitrososphaerota archaeon]